MQYTLKATDGKVKALLKSDNDLVADTLSVSTAQHIINSNALTESDVEGYPICAGKWYFEGEPIVEKKVETNDTVPTHFKRRKK